MIEKAFDWDRREDDAANCVRLAVEARRDLCMVLVTLSLEAEAMLLLLRRAGFMMDQRDTMKGVVDRRSLIRR